MNFLHSFLQYAVYRFIYNIISKFVLIIVVIYGVAYATGTVGSPSELISYLENLDYQSLLHQAENLKNQVPYFIRNMF